MLCRSLLAALALAAVLVAATASSTADSDALDLDLDLSEQYKVLAPGMHEYADCKALQKALKRVPNKLQQSHWYRGFAPKFDYGLLDCELFANSPPVTASAAGVAQRMVKASKDAVAAVGKFMKGALDTIKKALTPSARFRAISQGKAAEKAMAHVGNPNSLDDVWPALVVGAREMDLPCEDRDNALENCYMGVVVGAAKAMIKEKRLEQQGLDPRDVDLISKKYEADRFSPMARHSHFGYMSIGHAQTADRPKDAAVPGVVQALKTPSLMAKFGYTFPLRSTTAPVAEPTQQHVRDMIVDLLLHFFKLALAAAKKGDERFFVYHFARFGHTIMDSYSCAHTVRLNNRTKEFPLLFFQDYQYQDGGTHTENGDALPGDKAPYAEPGFNHGREKVAVGAQIFIHAAIAQATTPPSKYVPVISTFPGVDDPDPKPIDEMLYFLNTFVFHFAEAKDNYFAKFDAGGCVTADTLSATGNFKICPLIPAQRHLNVPMFHICPDRPKSALEAFK